MKRASSRYKNNVLLENFESRHLYVEVTLTDTTHQNIVGIPPW